MNKDNGNEMFPVVDDGGKVTGKATRAECHNGSHLLHPVVHLHVYNSAGQLYLQRRPDWKDIQPGKWDTAVGGHVDYNEEVEDALRREAREELGISGFVPEHVVTYRFDSDRESELVNVYRTVFHGELHPSDELDGGRYWSIDEIRQSMNKGIFTPNFEQEAHRFLGI